MAHPCRETNAAFEYLEIFHTGNDATPAWGCADPIKHESAHYAHNPAVAPLIQGELTPPNLGDHLGLTGWSSLAEVRVSGGVAVVGSGCPMVLMPGPGRAPLRVPLVI